MCNRPAASEPPEEQPFGIFTWSSFELISEKGVWETASDLSSSLNVLGKGEETLHMNAADVRRKEIRNLENP